MNTLHANISSNFGHEKRPVSTDLVIADGFDQFEKEDAVAFFSGKTWQDVLAYLQGLKNDPVFGAAYFLEEWAVLNPTSLAYYLRAYLEFLFETLDSSAPDAEFILHLLGQLRQVIHMHKHSPFASTQTALLEQLAPYVCDYAAKNNLSAYQEHDIEQYATQLLVDIEAYGS